MVFLINLIKTQISLPGGVNKLHCIVNELSIDGQYSDIESFEEAVDNVMTIRAMLRQSDVDLYCHRTMLNTQVTSKMVMQQAVNNFGTDKRRAFLQWITKHGPFWEDSRKHKAEEWFECEGDIVTDTGIGEAAWCSLHGIESSLISFVPSDWKFTPVKVAWVDAEETRTVCNIENYWTSASVETALQKLPAKILSWEQLQTNFEDKWPQLTFTDDAFAPLGSLPFNSSAADRIVRILNILNELKTCFGESGARTSRGHELYQNFFTGKKGQGGRGALFTDSSETEKASFKSELTFKHPTEPSKTLFCPWHGKVQTPQLRVHFSYPISAEEPLYIVYVGEKITKT